MLPFEYENSTRLVFGPGRRREIGCLLAPYLAKGEKLLLHYGGGSIRKNGVYADVTASLKEAGIAYTELGGVQPNPRLSLVREGISLCRREHVTMILAVGGGSVIDSAKAIALGSMAQDDVWDFYTGAADPEAALPVAAILTLPASGSESSVSTVITDDEKTGRKLGRNHRLNRPVFSVIDPEVFLSLPRSQMANGVCDMMSHIMERYFTNTPHTDVTDGMCEGILRAILQNARRLLQDAHDLSAWSELGFAGALAHNGLLGLGREEDWASHRIEHELSAAYDIAHGAGLAVVTPAWMKYTAPEHLSMFAQFAVNVMGVSGALRDTGDVAMEGIQKLTEFFLELGLPVTLPALGIDGTRLEELASAAVTAPLGGPRTLGGLKKLDRADVLAILKLAL